MTTWIDPQMQVLLELLRAGPAFDFRSAPIAEARATVDAATLPWSDGAPAIPASDLVIPTDAGAMRARLYRPEGAQAESVIVYAHGGGWTFGSIETHDGTMRNLAVAGGCAVLGVDYRLAPEHPFPAPLDDLLASVAFVERGGLGTPIPAERIAIAGDSAGANMALAALLRRRDEGLPPLSAAALFYGCYEPDFSTASHAAFGGGDYLLTSANMRWYWNNFLGAEPDETLSLAAPGRAALAGLPPLYLSAAGLDPLRDDTIRLAQRLGEAGVPFRFDHVPGVVHGCLRMSRELAAAADMITAGGRHIANHLNDKKTGGSQPWNAGLSSN